MLETGSTQRPGRASQATLGARGPRRVAVLVALALAVVSGSLHYAVELRLDRHQIFSQHNILFDADPNNQLQSFDHGRRYYGRNFAHPNLANYVHPFVWVIARA